MSGAHLITPRPRARLNDGTTCILLENYFFPGDLEASIEAFVDHYNPHRYHESINNLTPADACFGRGQAILEQRVKDQTKDYPNQALASPQGRRIT